MQLCIITKKFVATHPGKINSSNCIGIAWVPPKQTNNLDGEVLLSGVHMLDKRPHQPWTYRPRVGTRPLTQTRQHYAAHGQCESNTSNCHHQHPVKHHSQMSFHLLPNIQNNNNCTHRSQKHCQHTTATAKATIHNQMPQHCKKHTPVKTCGCTVGCGGGGNRDGTDKLTTITGHP